MKAESYQLKSIPKESLIKDYTDFCWQTLESFFGKTKGKIPPVYFFLAPWSKGSLKNRRIDEIELVHNQQLFGEGITLFDPPAAWISEVSQLPEEVAHLFAIASKKKEFKRQKTGSVALTLEEQFDFLTLHEAFGQFASCLVAGGWHKNSGFKLKKKQTKLSIENLWERSHQKGYALGIQLVELYYLGQVSQKQIVRWFKMDWEKAPRKAIKNLTALVCAQSH